MKFMIPCVVLALSAALAFRGEGRQVASINAAVTALRASDGAAAEQSVADLRRAGPEGLRATLAEYDRKRDPRLAEHIDAVAGQRDALWSRLYWYTDLAEAQAAAKAQHKPILYLRLMGRLTDEYSCANSRFFRTVLYANAEVSALLRERFVLVWQSERPVPVVTIDYGDGRTLKRTLTGNSAHYVLDADGRVVDALPGLFDPATFSRLVRAAGEVAMSGSASEKTQYAERAVSELYRDRDHDIAGLAGSRAIAGGVEQPAGFDAVNAMERTASKSSGGEMRLLKATSPQFAAAIDRQDGAPRAGTWNMFAARDAAGSRLDERSVALIRSQNPSAYSEPNALARTVDMFESSLAEDTARNNFEFRREVLEWLIEAPSPVGVEDLNRRVYSELFLTPRSDPWLGLVPEGVYTALKDNGCNIAATR